MNGLHTAVDPDYHSHPEPTPAVLVVTSTTRPANAREGQVVYEKDTDRLLVYDGTNWVQRGPVRVVGTTTGVVGGASPDQTTSPIPYVVKGGSDVQTYAAGGLTVTYSTAFPTGVLTVLISQGDNNASIPSVVNANNTVSSFKYKVFDTAGAEVGDGGLYRVNWLAVGW